MNSRIWKILFWISFSVMCSSLIGLVYNTIVNNNFSYENNLYEKRLDSMDKVDNLFPVNNQTLIITNLGWDSNLGGSILEFNHSYYGLIYFIYDGWELKRIEYK